MDDVRASKLLSLVLRHQPESVGVELDSGGWVNVDELLRALKRSGKDVTREQVERVVRESPKQRYILLDGRIRANQGHSVEVDLGLSPVEPPEILFHGTPRRNIEAILREGLLRGERQFVHLSPDRETAEVVGARRGEFVVFRVHASRMSEAEEFFCSANGVWLTRRVEREYLELE